MTDISTKSLYTALELAGFHRSTVRPRLFLTDGGSTVSAAFYCGEVKRRGQIRFSGGVGVVFPEFEDKWNASLSKKEQREDSTLPLIMALDNFEYLIENRVFRYSNNFDDLLTSARHINVLCSKLPSSIDEFGSALGECRLLGKPVSEYLHIFDYHADDNLYFRKSSEFILWFLDRWPNLADQMYKCLSGAQQKRLGITR